MLIHLSDAYFTGIEAIETEKAPVADANAPVEIYNLQGIRMNADGALTPGIYVKRQGNQVEKFVVR